METETIKAMAFATAFGSFMAVFAVYTVHARKVVCRAALTALLASIVVYTAVAHGAVAVLVVCSTLPALPLAAAFFAWVVINAMKASIESRYQASTGVTYTLKGTVAEMYRVVWASDHG